MTRRILTIAAFLTLAPSAHAQQPSGNPMSEYLRRSYAALARNLEAASAMMPEKDFGFRPAGAVTEVRTFGEIVAHINDANTFVCAMGDGKRDSTSTGSAPKLDKTAVLESLKKTNARCTAYLATLTDAALTQVITTGPPDRQLQSVRGNAVIFAIAHTNEHYGNLVTYLRANGLVPPPTAAQIAPVTPIKP